MIYSLISEVSNKMHQKCLETIINIFFLILTVNLFKRKKESDKILIHYNILFYLGILLNPQFEGFLFF